MKLYQSDLSPFAARVRMQIYHKGLDIPFEEPTTLGTPAYRQSINPIGKIPALEVDGTVLAESEVICEYLEDCFPKPAMRPADPLQRAKGRLLSRIGDLYVFAPLGGLFGQMNPATRDQAVLDEGIAKLNEGLGFLEAFLGDGPLATGRELSLADCTLVPILFFIGALGPAVGLSDALSGFPKLNAYYKAASADATCAKVIGELAAGLKKMQGG